MARCRKRTRSRTRIGGFHVNHSRYSGYTFSLLICLPLPSPSVVTGRSAQQNVVPLPKLGSPRFTGSPTTWRSGARIGRGNRAETPVFRESGFPERSDFPIAGPAVPAGGYARGVAGGFGRLLLFPGPSLAPSGTVTFPVQSAAEASADTTPSPCGTIPSIAQAYSFNVTMIPKTGEVAFVTVWPSSSPEPAVSTINDGQGVSPGERGHCSGGIAQQQVNVVSLRPATTDIVST